MKASTKAVAVVVSTLMAVVFTACRGDAGTPERNAAPTVPPTATPSPDQLPTLEDGQWFGFLITESDGAAVQLLIDPAEMLSGQPAHAAAVEAGFIAEDEDLPNDFYIANPEDQEYLVPITADAAITVLSGHAVDRQLTMSVEELAAIFSGTYQGDVVYGIAPGQPGPFDVTIVDGAATVIAQRYVP